MFMLMLRWLSNKLKKIKEAIVKESTSVLIVAVSLLLVAAGGVLTDRFIVEDTVTQNILGVICVIVGVVILVLSTSGYTLVKRGTSKPRNTKKSN